MDHGPAVQVYESEALKDYKQKLGLKLFFVYAAIYAIFVGINTIFPSVMEKVIFKGLNVAIIYGFGLIIFAIILGLVYNGFCTKKEKEYEGEEEK